MKKLVTILLAVFMTGFSAMAQLQPSTESMKSYLDLSSKQIRKIDRLNKRFMDVVGVEKTLGRPIYGDRKGPNFDTPARQHPKVEDKSLAKRRAKYVKKLGRVLSAEQFSTWKSRQRPFPGEANL